MRPGASDRCQEIPMPTTGASCPLACCAFVALSAGRVMAVLAHGRQREGRLSGGLVGDLLSGELRHRNLGLPSDQSLLRLSARNSVPKLPSQPFRADVFKYDASNSLRGKEPLKEPGVAQIPCQNLRFRKHKPEHNRSAGVLSGPRASAGWETGRRSVELASGAARTRRHGSRFRLPVRSASR